MELPHILLFCDENDDDFVVEMGCVESSKTTDNSASCKGSALQLNAVAGPPDHEPINNTQDLLSAEERAILKSEWSQLSRANHQDMGMRIFLRIFELEPSTKRSFSELYDLEGDELTSNTLFRCHGTRFMRAVAAAVDNMDALDLVVVPNLIQLGRLHQSVEGLSWNHLDAFEQSMAECWADELGISSSWSGSTSADVWSKVFRLISSKVYEGYQLSSENSSATAVKDNQQTVNVECPCQLPCA